MSIFQHFIPLEQKNMSFKEFLSLRLRFLAQVVLLFLHWFVGSAFVYWVIYCLIFLFWFFGAYGLAYLMDTCWYSLTGYHFYNWFFGFLCIFYWFLLIDWVRVYLRYVKKEPKE